MSLIVLLTFKTKGKVVAREGGSCSCFVRLMKMRLTTALTSWIANRTQHATFCARQSTNLNTHLALLVPKVVDGKGQSEMQVHSFVRTSVELVGVTPCFVVGCVWVVCVWLVGVDDESCSPAEFAATKEQKLQIRFSIPDATTESRTEYWSTISTKIRMTSA